MSINTSKKLSAACISAIALLFTSQSAQALNTGSTMWSTNNRARGDESHSWITYYRNQGSQGTYWVWRVQKYYPEFTLYCSTGSSSGCTANKTEGRFESVTTQLGFDISLAGEFKGAGGDAGFNYSKATTKGTSFQIGQTISMQSGRTAYAMVIALDKYIPAADYRGAWFKTGRARSRCNSANTNCLPPEYEMRWNNDYTFGTWRGHMITYHRSYMCAAATTVEPRVGDELPRGCSLPPLPSEYR